MIPGISLCSPHIPAHISPKSQHHIEQYRRPHGQYRGIHEILPDLTGGNTHPLANSCTYPKGIPFHKAFELVHIANLEKLNHSPNSPLVRQVFFRTFATL
jgi:hypothetical protein